MDQKLIQKVMDCITRGKYSDCISCLQSEKLENFGVSEWIKRNNLLVCECKLSTNGALPNIKKCLEDLLQQIKGVVFTDELISLMAVAAHNTFYVHLISECTHLDHATMSHSITTGQEYLRHTLNCVCEHFGITVADSNLNTLTSGILQFTNNAMHTDYTGLYLLLYSCAVSRVLSSELLEAKLLLTHLRERLKLLNATGDKHQPVYVLCHSCDRTENSGSDVLYHLCTELLMVTHFLLQDWNACLQYIDEIETRHVLQVDFKYFKCWIHFKERNYKRCMEYAEAETRRHLNCNNEAAARFLNITGCCLSSQGKYHSAIQKFQRALSTDFESLLPLYNISLQYRHLGVFTAELDCLELLISALGRNKSRTSSQTSHHNVTVPCGLLQGQVLLSGELCEKEILYTLAKRCFHLEKFQRGSAKYKELIKLLTSEEAKHCNSQPVCHQLPEIHLHEVYSEAAFCLLSAGQYTDSIQICDKLLEVESSLSSGHSVSQNISQNSEEDDDDFFSLLTDEKVASELKQIRERQSAPNADHENHTSLLAVLFYKADAMAHTGHISEALECLNRLTDLIETLQERLARESNCKRLKLDEDMNTDSKTAPTNTEETIELLQCAYLNKSILLMAEKRYSDALKVSRLAIQLKPDCEYAMYTHVLALMTLGRQREACSVWFQHRKLDVTGDHLQLQHLLRTRTDLLKHHTNLGENSKHNVQVVTSTSVTSEEYLKLDIQCITYMKDKR